VLARSTPTTDPSRLPPDVSVEVDDVGALHSMTVRVPIVYPLTTEPWGVRPFFVADPNGRILTIVSHHEASRMD
jgi:hypothetical protein